MALQAIARRPDAFGGAIALSGSLLDANGLTRASTGKPVFLTAGETDRVVPMAGSERAAATLKALGHDTELFRFPGGHTVNREVVEQVRQTLRRWTSTPR